MKNKKMDMGKIKKSVKIFVEKISNFLLKPFDKGVNFFLSVFFISALIDIIYSCCFDKLYIAAYFGMHHFVLSYILTLIYIVIPSNIRVLYKCLIYALLMISAAIDLVCAVVYQSRFSLDYADIIMGTNKKEMMEFAGTYITFDVILLLLLFIFIFCAFLWFLSCKKIHFHLLLQKALLFFVSVSIIYFFVCNHATHWDIVSLGKIKTFLSISNVNLKEYQIKPNLISKSKDLPQNVVLIIGESFSKSHSSLYGYPKNTNPCLANMQKNGEVAVYSDVITSGLHTIEAFKSVMSTFSPKSLDKDIEWFECLTVPSVMSTLNYHTEWISNQSRKGFYDNIVTKYASLCDTMIFSGNQYAGLDKTDKDGILIDITKKRIKENTDKNRCFYVIHLMGSHNDFKFRYTEDYNRFKSVEYASHKPNQRSLLAEYDNSILYNDYVVSELMTLFESKDAIVFYFSDHGLDVFDTRENYVGHAITGNPESCKAAEEIPFCIYTSPSFQHKYPQKQNLINRNINSKFCTENIIYSIMDILDVRFEDNNDVQQKSLFRHDE